MVESQGIKSPSHDRRQKLRDAGTIPEVSNFFSIERYYDASDKLLQAFEMSYESQHINNAYVYGRRYCDFCITEIPKHDYYRAKKFEARRNKTNTRVDDVLIKVQRVTELMDAEEVEKGKKIQALIAKQKEERLKKQRELEQKRINDLQKRIEKQKISSSYVSSESLEESALAKLQRLSQPQGIQQLPKHHHSDQSLEQNKKVRMNLPAEPDGHLLSQNSLGSTIDFPPPLLPPSKNCDKNQENHLPPSYNSILKHSSYFGPSMANSSTTTELKQHPTASYDQVVNQEKKEKQLKNVPLRQRIKQINAKHRKYLQEGKIQISPLRTYQGRISGSTNGCTVISACVVSKHMESHGGVSEVQVQSVIDSECVSLLKAIRKKLDLGHASLIIPSDVHDYLVDHKLLYQHKFAGVAGGNITNPVHLGDLIDLLRGELGKTSQFKSGATLFFREHVISIVKFPKNANEAVYDLIDSLPTCNGRGSRTRCHSLDALKVHLEYYCTGKFSDSNIKYIENNRWDDAMADFDPRVFQSFVWTDLPKPKT
mmetsp:Transcript_16826/g.19390  ORF Transcript_16826/g.19390 Transcript_16826/m.19390 type:complete len:540 (-) Transcript_16826:261-1880(-)